MYNAYVFNISMATIAAKYFQFAIGGVQQLCGYIFQIELIILCSDNIHLVLCFWGVLYLGSRLFSIKTNCQLIYQRIVYSLTYVWCAELYRLWCLWTMIEHIYKNTIRVFCSSAVYKMILHCEQVAYINVCCVVLFETNRYDDIWMFRLATKSSWFREYLNILQICRTSNVYEFAIALNMEIDRNYYYPFIDAHNVKRALRKQRVFDKYHGICRKHCDRMWQRALAYKLNVHVQFCTHHRHMQAIIWKSPCMP